MRDYNQFTPLRRLIDGDYASSFKIVANALLSRPLTPRHFEKIHATIGEFRKHRRILTEVGFLNGNFQASRISGTMPYGYQGIFYETIGNHSHIAHLAIAAHQTNYFYSARTLPLRLGLSHVQGQHSIRAEDKNVIDFGSSSFSFLLYTGLLVSKVAEEYLENLGETRAEIFIPTQEGLFLGYCQKETEDTFDKFRIIRARREVSREPVDVKPVWKPTVSVNMRTFIEYNKTTPGTTDNV